MSRTTNDWIAKAGNAMASAVARTRRSQGKLRIEDSAREQAVDVVVEREEGQAEKQREPETLSDLHGPFRDGTSLHNFGEIIHQVPPIQQGNRQQVEHAEAHAHERQEAEVADPAELRRLPGVIRDRDRTGEVFPRYVAGDHAT